MNTEFESRSGWQDEATDNNLNFRQLPSRHADDSDALSLTARRTVDSQNAQDSREIQFCVCISGSGRLIQRGKVIDLLPGAFAIYDPAHPPAIDWNPGARYEVLRVAQGVVTSRLGAIAPSTAICSEAYSSLTRLTAIFISNIGKLPPDFDQVVREKLVEQLVDLIALATTSRYSLLPVTGGTDIHSVSARIRSAINLRLTEHDFDISVLSCDLCLSPDQINASLKRDGTSFSRYLLDQRVARCARDLRDKTLKHRSIKDIAFRWGFTNLSVFSNAFKERLTVCPRDYRTVHLTRQVQSINARSTHHMQLDPAALELGR